MRHFSSTIWRPAMTKRATLPELGSVPGVYPRCAPQSPLPLSAFAAPGLAAPPAARTTTTPVKEAWDQTAPRAEAGWVRLNPVPGRPSAGYLAITGGGQPNRGGARPGVRIEMHSMTMNGGVMAMAKLDGLAVPAGLRIAFAPGGNHLNSGPRRAPKPCQSRSALPAARPRPSRRFCAPPPPWTRMPAIRPERRVPSAAETALVARVFGAAK